MDPDVRAKEPIKCPRCGMRLVAGLPDPHEYPVDLALSPRALKPGNQVSLTFRVRDPKTHKLIRDFETIHEKLFHLFIVSGDLRYFAHEHPILEPSGSFEYKWTVPQSGQFRLLADFYPRNGTPQLIAKTIIAAGRVTQGHTLEPDLAAKQSENLRVSLTTEPAEPIAGKKTMLFFHLEPGDKLEPYLGAWGHLLAVSSDLIDMTHSHPAWENAGATIQFNVIFPRRGIHRVWVQFQRDGKVNTAAFNVPVSELK